MITATACLALALAVQQAAQEPRRPSLAPGADTNSAADYYQHGVRRLRRSPAEAAAAFYWAARLNPEPADYVYARYVALLLSDEPRLLRYFSGDPRAWADPQLRAIDSLMGRALRMDPFLHRRLDDIMQFEVARTAVARDMRYSGENISDSDLQFLLRYVADRDRGFAAIQDYSTGNFRGALDWWASEARRQPANAYLHSLRARAFFLMGAFDSARVAMQRALAIARRGDADSLRFYYESKAAWEYGLGRIYERLADHAAARRAFEQALSEDLSFYPAHIQLGMLHAERGDTAAALREFARAVAVKEDEYLPRMTYAFFLASRGQLDSARAHLDRAIALEPYAAAPRLMLGVVLDTQGNAPGALAAFEAFLARAPRSDQDLVAVRARAAELRAAGR